MRDTIIKPKNFLDNNKIGLSDTVSSRFEYLHLTLYFWASCDFILERVTTRKMIWLLE